MQPQRNMVSSERQKIGSMVVGAVLGLLGVALGRLTAPSAACPEREQSAVVAVVPAHPAAPSDEPVPVRCAHPESAMWWQYESRTWCAAQTHSCCCAEPSSGSVALAIVGLPFWLDDKCGPCDRLTVCTKGAP